MDDLTCCQQGDHGQQQAGSHYYRNHAVSGGMVFESQPITRMRSIEERLHPHWHSARGDAGMQRRKGGIEEDNESRVNCGGYELVTSP